MAKINKDENTKALAKQPKRHIRASIKRAFAALGIIGLGIFGHNVYVDMTTVDNEKIEELEELGRESTEEAKQYKEFAEICKKVNNLKMKDEEEVRETCTEAFDVINDILNDRMAEALKNQSVDEKSKAVEIFTEDEIINKNQAAKYYDKLVDRGVNLRSEPYREEKNAIVAENNIGTVFARGNDEELDRAISNKGRLLNYSSSYYYEGLSDGVSSKQELIQILEAATNDITEIGIKLDKNGNIISIEKTKSKENDRTAFVSNLRECKTEEEKTELLEHTNENKKDIQNNKKIEEGR